MKLATLRLPRIRKANIISFVFFSLSALIFGMAIYMNTSIDVLKNWSLILPKGDLHAGDTIVVQSVYEKTMNVTGKATRYVECESRPGVFVRYPVSEAVANRGTGGNGTGIEISIPDNIPKLPATCKVSIIIDYEIAWFRHVVESNSSGTFTLLPAVEDESRETSQAPSEDESQIASLGDEDVPFYSSSSQHSAPASDNQRDISQGEPVVNNERTLVPTPEPVEQPKSFLDVVLDFVLAPVRALL